MAVLSGSDGSVEARLPVVGPDQAALTVRAMYADGDPSNITKVLAGSPDTLAAMAPFLAQVMNPTTLDLAIKEVVVLRVSVLNRCAYCVPTHQAAARRQPGQGAEQMPRASVAVLAAAVAAREWRVHQHDARDDAGIEMIIDLRGVEACRGGGGKEPVENAGAGVGKLVENE